MQEAKPDSDSSSRVDLEFSKEVISNISKTEAERLLPGGSEAERKEKEMEITERMVIIFLLSLPDFWLAAFLTELLRCVLTSKADDLLYEMVHQLCTMQVKIMENARKMADSTRNAEGKVCLAENVL